MHDNTIPLGRGWGLILAGVVVVIGVAWLSSYFKERQEQHRLQCASNLKSIGFACVMYASEDLEQGRFPRSFQALTGEHLVDCPAYECPAEKTGSPFAAQTAYVYYGQGLSDRMTESARRVVAHCSHHHDGWLIVMFSDGHVERLQGKGLKQAAKEQDWIID